MTLLLALVAVLLATVVRSRPGAERQIAAPVVARVLAEPPLAAATGTALIDAIPWGRIERIESPTGERYRVPAMRETPVLLELPAGEWRIALSNPAAEEEHVCDLDMSEGSRLDCLVEFGRLSVDQYFQDAGWWR